MTPATEAKRNDLLSFIERVLQPEPSVQAVIGIGSIATGHSRPGSDIDIVVFFDPMDWYIIPAEFIWRPLDGSYHSIFTEDEDVRQEGIALDCRRLDLRLWNAPEFDWPEGRKAELCDGWMAYDREDRVAPLIASKTAYSETIRLKRLDEAIIWLDQHLGDGRPEERWESLGPLLAHDRLQAAFQYLARALFALSRRWMPWRNRQMDNLMRLSWLPDDFYERALEASNAPSLDFEGYMDRVRVLRSLFDDVLAQIIADGSYSTTPIDQAFIRSHDEPGYSWNMDEWRAENLGRFLTMVTGEDE
ncbi:MAG: nucleotidyltransferase domain-containing protein [Candidatus Promineifilaceae bacterium]